MQLLSNKINNGGATSQGQLSSANWNEPTLELENLITSTGVGLSGSDFQQAVKSVAYYSTIGDFYNETGITNTYAAVAPVPRIAPSFLTIGMKIRLKPINTNTGNSTLNAFGLGPISIRMKGGINEIPAGSMVAGDETLFEYDGTFWILIQSLALYDGQSIIPKDTVSDMISDPNIRVGNIVKTLGYTTINDDGSTNYLIVPGATFTADGGSVIDLSASGLQAQALFGLEYNLVQFGNIADSSRTEVAPFSSTNNITQINKAFTYGMTIKNISCFVNPGIFRYENVDHTDAVTVWGLNLGFRIYGAGAGISTLFNSGGGTNSRKTCLLIGRNQDVHSAFGVVGATLAEYAANDLSNLNTSHVYIHDIGFQQELGKETGANQGGWMTNCEHVHVRNIGSTRCSTPFGIGNDNEEAVRDCSLIGIHQFEPGRWYDIFIGQSENIIVGGIVHVSGRGPELESLVATTSRNIVFADFAINCTASTAFGGGFRNVGTLLRSENIVINNLSVSDSTGAGISLFEAFNLSPPNGAPTGPTHHKVSGSFDRNNRACVTAFTDENIIDITFDRNDIETTKPSATITLAQAGVGVGVTVTSTAPAFDVADINKRIAPTTGLGIAVITGFTSDSEVTVEITEQMSSGSYASSLWEVIDGGGVYFKTNGDNNEFRSTRGQGGRKYIREDGTARKNLVNYAAFDIRGRMETGNRIIGKVTPGGTDIAWQINSPFGTSGRFQAGSGGIIQLESGTAKLTIDQGTPAAYPSPDNTLSCGQLGNRWSELFSVNSTINTSDEREKTEFTKIDDMILNAWQEVSYGQYQWKDALEKKGENARFHFGLGAQSVLRIFEEYNIDPTKYGFFCYDEWGDKIDDAGEYITYAGNRYGLRYSQCAILEAACQRRTNIRLQEITNDLLKRIEALEK